MAGEVKFEGDWHPPQHQRRQSEIVQWITTHSGGYVKDEKQAVYVVLTFVAFIMAISLILFFQAFFEEPHAYRSSSTAPPYQQK